MQRAPSPLRPSAFRFLLLFLAVLYRVFSSLTLRVKREGGESFVVLFSAQKKRPDAPKSIRPLRELGRVMKQNV